MYAYDHTIDSPPNRGNNIHYFKTGLGIGQNLKTLPKLLMENGHSEATIEYLKVKSSSDKTYDLSSSETLLIEF